MVVVRHGRHGRRVWVGGCGVGTLARGSLESRCRLVVHSNGVKVWAGADSNRSKTCSLANARCARLAGFAALGNETPLAVARGFPWVGADSNRRPAPCEGAVITGLDHRPSVEESRVADLSVLFESPPLSTTATPRALRRGRSPAVRGRTARRRVGSDTGSPPR